MSGVVVEGEGGSRGEQGTEGVRETRQKRAGRGISTKAGRRREIQKGKRSLFICLSSSQKHEPNNVF